MTAKALLDEHPHPTRDQIKEALSGNLCRCTGYQQIFEAVEQAIGACGHAEPQDTANPRRGRNEHHRQAAPPRRRPRQGHRPDRVRRRRQCCRGCCTASCCAPRSRTRASSRIDTSRAAAHPGVHLVLTGRDFPIPYGILPVSQDEYALEPERVRFVGDPVAAVIARDELTAFEALDLDRRRVRAAPHLRDARGEPRARRAAHPRATAIAATSTRRSRSSSATSSRPSPTPTGCSRTRSSTRATRTCRSSSTPRWRRRIRTASSCSGRARRRRTTSTARWRRRSAMPAAHIRVIATPNGGGFGGKSDPFNHEIVVAKAALLLDRPVKICLTREEVFYCHRGRHPVLMRFKTGVKKDGTITGVHLKTLLDGGAYGSYGVASTFYTGALQTVTYHIPAYQLRGLPRLHEQAAVRPEARPRHAAEPLRPGNSARQDRRVARDRSGRAPPAHRRAARHADGQLPARRHDRPRRMHPARRQVVGLGQHASASCRDGRGVGLACSSYLSGAGLPIYWNDMPHSGVQLKLDRSGGVAAFCGATEIGQGSDDVLVACVAEVLGIDPLDMRAVTGDTDLTPVDLGSYSSRVTLMMGNAAIQAAERARDLLADAVSRKLEIPKDRARLRRAPRVRRRGSGERRRVQRGGLPGGGDVRHDRHGRLVHAAALGRALQGRRRRSLADLFLLGGGRRSGRGRVDRLDHRAARVDRARHRPRAEPDARARTGRGRASTWRSAKRSWKSRSSAASRRACRTRSCTSSRRSSNTRARRRSTCPRSSPSSSRTRIRRGPFGAKEVGQGPLLPVMPALANAVYDAIGVRIDEVPITPEKIVKALQAKAAGRAAALRSHALPRRAVPGADPRGARRGKAATAGRPTEAQG